MFKQGYDFRLSAILTKLNHGCNVSAASVFFKFFDYFMHLSLLHMLERLPVYFAVFHNVTYFGIGCLRSVGKQRQSHKKSQIRTQRNTGLARLGVYKDPAVSVTEKNAFILR